MTKVSFQAELKDHQCKDGRRRIYIRITENRKHKRIDTGIKVLKCEWDGIYGKWINRKHPDHLQMNLSLQSRITQYQKSYLSLVEAGALATKESVVDARQRSQHNTDFLNYYDMKVARMSNYNQSKGYQTTRRKIIDFTGKKALSFQAVTTYWLEDFCKFYRNQLSAHSLYTNLKRIRAIYNHAIKDGVVERSSYPFFTFSMPKYKTAPIEKLEKEQLRCLFSLSYPKGSHKFWALAAFELSFRCAGVRVEDLLTLKWSNVNGDYLTYRMNKGVTGGTIMRFGLTQQLRNLLEKMKRPISTQDDFILPYLKKGDDQIHNEEYKKKISCKTACYNRILKQISLDADLPVKLRSHLARHCWAFYIYGETHDLKFTQEFLGHSEARITEKYIGRLNAQTKIEQLQRLEL